MPTGSENIPSGNSAFEQEVFRLVNAERAKRKIAPLSWNENLTRAARYHAADMARQRYFSHDSMARIEGDTALRVIGSPRERIKAFDANGSAENIAQGQPTPARVMESWINSPGHRENMLRATVKTIGIGFVGGYWVMNLGR